MAHVGGGKGKVRTHANVCASCFDSTGVDMAAAYSFDKGIYRGGSKYQCMLLYAQDIKCVSVCLCVACCACPAAMFD